jgi:hypothetical protein
MAASLLFAGASSALNIMGGLFGYLASQDQAAIGESRARMFRMEAEADAMRYAEQARGFKAQQKVNYLKSGVTLSGSPLDILDETARVASENLSAIRARGEAEAMGMENEAQAIRMKGRLGLLTSITGGATNFGLSIYQSQKTAASAEPRNNTPR